MPCNVATHGKYKYLLSLLCSRKNSHEFWFPCRDAVMCFHLNVNTFQKIFGQHEGPGHIETDREPQTKPVMLIR